jgi:hypothetical protein
LCFGAVKDDQQKKDRAQNGYLQNINLTATTAKVSGNRLFTKIKSNKAQFY